MQFYRKPELLDEFNEKVKSLILYFPPITASTFNSTEKCSVLWLCRPCNTLPERCFKPYRGMEVAPIRNSSPQKSTSWCGWLKTASLDKFLVEEEDKNIPCVLIWYLTWIQAAKIHYLWLSTGCYSVSLCPSLDKQDYKQQFSVLYSLPSPPFSFPFLFFFVGLHF